MRAWSTGAKTPHEHAALVATLLTETAAVTLWTLVDDRRLRQTCGQAEWQFVRRTLAETEAALSTRVVTIRLAALKREGATAGTTRAWVGD
jgi:hypothetical protein